MLISAQSTIGNRSGARSRSGGALDGTRFELHGWNPAIRPLLDKIGFGQIDYRDDPFGSLGDDRFESGLPFNLVSLRAFAFQAGGDFLTGGDVSTRSRPFVVIATTSHDAN
jgi:hypothetical protein